MNKGLLKEGIIIGIPLSLSYIFQNLGFNEYYGLQYCFYHLHLCGDRSFHHVASLPKNPPQPILLLPLLLWADWLLSFNESFHIASGDIITLGCSLMLAIHMVILGRYSKTTIPFY